ncbi:MAG: radical SAM protein [Muribaculaceae bacterium]|nr:radical SAM protein [Muribaculaceae bacterium]
MYRINEIFYSLQGEGYHTGTPAVFVRFSGCNLACRFCDTDHRSGTLMTARQIAQTVLQYPEAALIVLTGGEPTLTADEALVQTIKSLAPLPIAIETNGTRPIPEGIDWVTFSPKDAFEGGGAQPCVLTTCDELKVVYCGQDLARYDHIKALHRFLQPCYAPDPEVCKRNVQACVQAVLHHRGWRLSLQTHRLLNIP